jgi:TMEM175 potassium channel family protein
MAEKASTTSRLEAFSDGVFAIAITLLILEIKVPTADEVHSADGLWLALAERWPNYVGYVLSFLVIGVMWTNHHAIFEYLKRIDRALIITNLFLLMGVSFLPFPTAVLADHLTNPSTRVAATAFYGATLVFTSITFNLLWWLGRRHRRFVETSMPAQGMRTITRRYAIGLVGYVVATCLAFVNVWLSLAIHFALALWNGFSERR